MLLRYLITSNHPQLHDVLTARPRPRVSDRDFCSLSSWSLSLITCKIAPPTYPDPLPLPLLRSSYLASRENINPHSHTFSMARRVRR